MAPDGDEGRGYLRKASGSGKHALIRGCPNGETHLEKIEVRPAEFIGGREPTQGSEPSQYLKEKKATAIPLVAASERGTAQTRRSFEIISSGDLRGAPGVVGRASV